MIGRYCEINKLDEVSTLKPGLDFRDPCYRREVFLNFYEFHLKYKAHPGAVYYMFPYLKEKMNLNMEDMLWMAFINGCSQNIITTWIIFNEFPSIQNMNILVFSDWFREHYDKLGWDTDRRYIKNKLEEVFSFYQALIGNGSQLDYFEQVCPYDDPYMNFNALWQVVINSFYTFGRLASFSYIEYLRIVGVNVDCSTLFIDDLSGSKSHRNGLCRVLGRDDLDWHDKLNPSFKGYTKEHFRWLEREGEVLLNEAKERFKNTPYSNDVSYFTLESTLCCYKSWHRPNRRYPNVYNDMFFERIKYAESKWKGELDFSIFRDARKQYLPEYLRVEDNPNDPGLKPIKQNHYLNTGQVIMMDKDFNYFSNDFGKVVS